MSTRTIRNYKRIALETLARSFEATGLSPTAELHTCIAVQFLGYDTQQAYKCAFGFEGPLSMTNNEAYLWARCPKTQRNLRVLMLCFAAAMAGTGDL